MAFSLAKYHFKMTSLFDDLPQEESNFLKQHAIRQEEKAGKIIYREGAYSKGVYILKRGKIKIYQTNKDGKEQIVYIYKKDEFMGYRPLLCDSPHPVSAKALEDVVILFIPKKYFLAALNQFPILPKKLLTNLSFEFSVWINKLSVFAQQQVKERVALSLLILNKKYMIEGRENMPVTINLSREDIANFVGTTVETLVRMLRYFKDEKIITTRGRKITILKTKELEKIAESY